MKAPVKLVILAVVSALVLAGCASGQNTKPTSSAAQILDTKARELLPSAVKKSGVLRIATDATYSPNEFVNDSGAIVGWEIDLIKAIAKHLGLRPVVTQVGFNDIFAALNSGQQDIAISSFFDTKERELQVDMVNYYKAGTLWAKKAGSTVDPKNSCGLTVAVQKDSYQAIEDLPKRSQDCVANGRAAIKILLVNLQDQAYSAIKLGRADAAVADSPVTLYNIAQSQGALAASGSTYDTHLYGMPLAKGSELTPAVKEAFQALLANDGYRSTLASWGVQDGAVSAVSVNGAN